MDNEKHIPDQEQKPEDEVSLAQPGWFQDFVERYDQDKPQRGEILKAKILDIQENSILLDVGLKSDAIIPGHDLDQIDQEIRTSLSVGDEIFVSVIRTPEGSDDLLVSLYKGLAHETWQKAEELAANDQLIELKVVDKNRGGLLVEYENLRGFIPNSHIPSIRKGTSTQKAGEIKSELIGKSLPLKVIEVDEKEQRLVFSARVAQKEGREKRIQEIIVGEIVKSRVVNVVDFGVFVDLEGVDGLVHKSELSWDRISHPSTLYQVGDEIEVKIVGVDKEKERVSLSKKALLPNPWLKKIDNYQVGGLIEGVVVNMQEFGAFVELEERFHGLVHVSEIGYANPEDPKAALRKGDPVLVKILSIDHDRERISLSMRRVPISEQMEWIMNLDDLAEGQILDGDLPGEEAPSEVEVAPVDNQVVTNQEVLENKPEDNQKQGNGLESETLDEVDTQIKAKSNANSDQGVDD